MTLEWLSFQEEFRPKAFTRMRFAPDQICMRHSLKNIRFSIFNLEQSLFSVNMIMKFRTRTIISFGMKTGMNSFRNDLYRNEMSFRYHVIKYREIYGALLYRDKMNSFLNESHSGIMWTAPYLGSSCRAEAWWLWIWLNHTVSPVSGCCWKAGRTFQ